MENRKIRMGVIPSGRVRKFRWPGFFGTEPLREIDYSACIIPSDIQDEGSCVARATCNMIEAHIRIRSGRDAIEAGKQLDAKRLYWEARKRFYGDKSDAGLQLDQALRVAIDDWQILPPDTQLIEIEPTLRDLVHALFEYGPFIQAQLVGDNWAGDVVDPNTGWIPYRDNTPFNSWGGHATCAIGYQRRAETDLLYLQNSWANWGWHSIGCQSWDTWCAGWRFVMDGPYAVKFSPAWTAWETWRNYLV